MAKIPIILEAGRADGKLIKTNSIYDDDQKKFLSDKIKEIDNNHNELNNTVNFLTDTVNNNELDIENKLEVEQTRATNAENNLRETINNITEISGSATTANVVTIDTIPTTSSSNVQQALNELFKNATYAGIATPTTNPGTPDGPVFYFATKAGTYYNFNGIELAEGETAILQWNNKIWFKNIIDFINQNKLTELDNDIKKRYGEIVENSEFVYVLIDAKNKILFGIKKDGTIYSNSFNDLCKKQFEELFTNDKNIVTSEKVGLMSPTMFQNLLDNTNNLQEINTHFIENNEWIRVITDNDGKILYGVKKSGEFYIGRLPDNIKNLIDKKVILEYKEQSKEAIIKLNEYESYKGHDLTYNGLDNPTIITVKNQEEFEQLPSRLADTSLNSVRVLIYEGVYYYSGVFIEKTDEITWNNIEIIGVGNVKIIGTNKQVDIDNSNVSYHKDNYSIPIERGFDRNLRYYNGNTLIEPTSTESLTESGFFESEILLIKVRGKITGYSGQSGETIKVVIGLEYNKKDIQSDKDYTFDFVSTGNTIESFKSDFNAALISNGYIQEEQEDGSILISKADGSSFSASNYMVGLRFLNETCSNTSYIIYGFVYKANNVLGLPEMTEEECKDVYIQVYKDYNVCMQNVIKITNDTIYIGINTKESDESYPLSPVQHKGDQLRIRVFNLKSINNEPLIYKDRLYIPYRYQKLYVLDSNSMFFKYCKTKEDKGVLRSLLISNINFVGGHTCIKINHVVSNYIGIENCRFLGFYNCINLNYSSNIHITDNVAVNVTHLLNGLLILGVAVVLRNSVNDTIYRGNRTDYTAHAINVSPESGWIAYNKLKNCYGGGFNFSLGEAGFYSIDGKLPTIIEYNEVYFDNYAAKNRYKYGFGDLGGIYTYVNNYWLFIRHNYVHNLVGYREDAIVGIYIDGAASNVVIYGNLVLDCNRSLTLYVPSTVVVKIDPETGLTRYSSKNRFVMSNIFNNRSKLDYNKIYDDGISMNGGNIVIYDTVKPEITYLNMVNNETYIPNCKISDLGILSIPLEYLYILLNFKLSTFITEKINNKYNG